MKHRRHVVRSIIEKQLTPEQKETLHGWLREKLTYPQVVRRIYGAWGVKISEGALAAFLGGDVQQASTLFGRALAGHTEMLARYGIEVDKSASKTQQLHQIMTELEQRGGGQFEARIGTISKDMEGLSKSTGGFLRAWGI